MNKKNLESSSNFLQTLKEKISKLSVYIQQKGQKHKKGFEKIQITLLYMYAILFQLYTVANIVGTFPAFYYKLFPFIRNILEIPLFKLLASPEKTFILYLLFSEIIIFRPIAKFSILFKFNTLYICILELIQNVLFSYLDFFFSTEFEEVMVVRGIMTNFVWNIYTIFLFIYIYSYFRAMQGLFPKFPGILQKVIDSVAFWLRIKRVPKKTI